MSTKRVYLIILAAVFIGLCMMTGAFGILVGRARTPWTVPTQTPTAVTPTPGGPDVVPNPGTGFIGGQVWHDLCAVAGGETAPPEGCVQAGDGYRANGVFEANEPGIGGVLVQLGAGACPASGLATTTTDTTGAYAFDGLAAGTFCVSADVQSPQNASLLPGAWTAPATAANTYAAGHTITLVVNERKATVDFGWDYQRLPVPDPESPESPDTPEPSPPPTYTDRAAFVSDVTVPDNTYVSPGQSFVKTWRLRNTGTSTWTTDYDLVFADGHRMGGPASVPLPRSVSPGETVDLSVTLTAPSTNGTYEGKWQLQNGAGHRFGTGGDATGVFWVRIIAGTPPTAWRGEYYGNRDLVGTPALVRNDEAVNFNWGTAAPAAGLPADSFSARWTRTLSLEKGTYRFYAYSDDGVRVWLDGELIIDQWRDTAATTYSAERTLSAGAHAFRVEYYEHKEAAQIRFWWERLGDFPQWRGEYFSNVGLTGAPTLTRNDAAAQGPGVDFDWGRGAPATGLPTDNFSVRWTRVLWFEEGSYRFHAVVDDGVRVYVDGSLVIDEWRDGARRNVESRDVRLSSGNHTLRVEYYERKELALIQVWWTKSNAYPDWKGEYWSNRNLQGNPALARNVIAIDFNWGQGAPATGLPADDFSARWTRTSTFDAATYRFHILVDDGARLWVDNRLILDAWHDGGPRELTADYSLTQGSHPLRVEYYEHSGDARIRVWWEKVSSPSYPDWKGKYWSNRKLDGDPALIRNDKAGQGPGIDFQWNAGAPAAGLPADNFSARWTRKMTFEPGVYRFHAWSDDGFRFYLDGELMLDEWHVSKGSEVYVVDLALRGQHELKVEYYEQGGNAFVRFWWKRVGDWPPQPNRPPTVKSDAATTNEDMAVNVNVLANDSDPDGDTLKVSSHQATSAQGGTVSCTGAGVCIYTPPANFDGADVFTYTASDGKGGSAVGTVSVTVKPVNDPPVAVDDSVVTEEDVAVGINVLINDSDPEGDTLTVSSYQATSTQGGTVGCTTAGTCTYTPPADFNSTDVFTYTASDGKGGSDSGTVSVTVKPVNDPPVAVDDSATTEQIVAVDVNVLANDSDPDGDTLTITSYQAASAEGGTANCASHGICTYSPLATFSGADTFTYTISDGKGGSATATVIITVTASGSGDTVNAPPVAVDDAAIIDKGVTFSNSVLLNDWDPDNDALTIDSYQAVSTQGGTVTCYSGGTCTYTPPAAFSGTDTFTYTVTDGKGGMATATVRVTVNPT